LGKSAETLKNLSKEEKSKNLKANERQRKDKRKRGVCGGECMGICVFVLVCVCVMVLDQKLTFREADTETEMTPPGDLYRTT
jgi:hypothetical protein